MARYLLLKPYRGGPQPLEDTPMDRWTPREVSAHMQFMQDFADRLQPSGEYIDGQALSPEGTFVRSDGEGRPPARTGRSPSLPRHTAALALLPAARLNAEGREHRRQ